MFDADRNGTISAPEFAKLWGYVNKWKATFDRLDASRDGTMDTAELKGALESIQYRFSPAFYPTLLQTYDRDRSGKMEFDEFLQLMCDLEIMTNQFKVHDTQRQGQITVNYENFLGMVMRCK